MPLVAPAASIAAGSRALPLAFEPTGRPGHFTARASGGAAHVAPGGAVIAAHGARPVRLRPLGAAKSPRVSAGGRLPGVVNRLVGQDPSMWRTGIPLFGSVTQHQVYPGIDLVFHTRKGALEYDFVARPGADPRRIRLKVEGARRLGLGRRGDLLIRTRRGTLRQRRPVAYQRVGGARRRVPARFVLLGRGRVRFALGRYDPARTLVVDPVLAFSSYLGGTGSDEGEDVTADAAGNAYVAGRSSSFDFPVANGFDTRCGTDAEAACNPYDSWTEGQSDAFVAKLDAAGTLLWATYVGGGKHDSAGDIALDSSLRPTVSGLTDSLDFPVTAGAYKTTWPNGCAQTDCWSSYVLRLAPDGRSLAWSTLFDGGLSTRIQDLAVDGSGDVALAGYTGNSAFPRTLGALGSAGKTTPPAGRDEAFLTKLDGSGASLDWSGMFGGADEDAAWGVAIGPSGDLVVAGRTASHDFFTTPGAPQRSCDGHAPSPYTDSCTADGFVMRVPASGAEPTYSTYLGGDGEDAVYALALDADGRPLVAGSTVSDEFPAAQELVDSPYQRTFVARLPAAGGPPEWASLVAGGDSFVAAVAPAPSGDVYAAGSAYGPLAVPPVDAVQGVTGGGRDGWIMRVAAGGGSHRWSTWLGGAGYDGVSGLATVPGGLVVTGTTGSLDFPTRAAADGALGDGACRVPQWCPLDAFVARMTEAAPRAAYDDFAQRRRLAAIAGYAYSDSTAATREAGEPGHAGVAGGRSLWFEWTAPATRTVAFDTADSGFDTALAVYRGDSLGAVTPVAANDDAAGRQTSRVVFTARQGRTYKIAVDGKGGAGGLVRLAWEGAPPHNDDFLDAQAIAGDAGEAAGNVVYATMEEDEPPGDYGDPVESIWFRWTAPSTGVYVFSGAGGDVPAALDVFRGERVELLERRQSVLEARAGLTYSIRLYPATGLTGDVKLSWRRSPRPANDDLADARPITTAEGSTSGETYAATGETGEPETGGHSVWFRWAPPAGTYELALSSTDWDDDLYVYEGSGYENLKRIAWQSEKVRLGLEAGESVLVAFDVFGPYELTWKPASAPPNDLFSAARALPAAGGDEMVPVRGGTAQPGEPPGWAGAWFTWTAPASGPVTFDISEQAGGWDESLSVFSGNAIRSLTHLGTSTYDRPYVTWNATAGATYRIRLAGSDAPRRSLVWAFGRPANDDFAAARALTGSSGELAFSMAHATEQAGEPDTHGGAGTAWFSWTAPSSGQATFTTVGSAQSVGLDVFSGSQLSSLTWVRVGESNGSGYTATFPASAGTTYRIRTYGAAIGQTLLTWNRAPTESEAPVADIIWPLPGAYVRDLLNIRSRAFDRREVSRVDFFVGATKVASHEKPGYGEASVTVSTRGLADGPAQITARPLDPYGNTSTSPPIDVVIDNTPPQTTIASGPSGSTSARTATLTFGASEPVVRRWCRLDYAPWFECAEQLTIEELQDGPHTLDVRVEDRAGNLDLTPARRTWTVNGTEPEPEPQPTPAPEPELPPDPPPTGGPTPGSGATSQTGSNSQAGSTTQTDAAAAPIASGAEPLSSLATSRDGELQLSVTLARTRLTVATLRRGLRVAAGCSSACTLTGKLVLVLRGSRTIARTSATGRAGATVTLRLRVKRPDLVRVRRRGAKLKLLVTARSPADTATIRRVLTVRPR